MRVEAASPLISPAYDSGASEASIVARWRDRYAALANDRLRGDS
jgi:hypothetical protein